MTHTNDKRLEVLPGAQLIREIGSVGYLVKGRKKVWFHTDSELQKLIAGTLIKGKGAR